MKKALPFLIVGFLVLFVVLVQLYAPKTINWSATFEKRDKNPYGDYLLHDFLKDLFPGKKITEKNKTLYEELDYYDYTQSDYTYSDSIASLEGTEVPEEGTDLSQDSINAALDSLNVLTDSSASIVNTEERTNEEEDELQNSKIIPDLQSQYDTSSRLKNYVIINGNFSPGESDANALLTFVQEGNCAFIATQQMAGILADTLNIKLNIGSFEEELSSEDLTPTTKKDSTFLILLNKNLAAYNKKYWYRDGTVTGYFSSVDTANTLILGKNSDGKANLIRVHYGNGYFFFSATPLAYTNYNMILANNAEYISASLSYLPVRDTYWDEYYKDFRESDSNSLRFVENQPPLYWAYYIALWSAFVYIVFESKRRQRMIPIVEPPKNTTVEFVSTIGRLYFQNGNHKDIAGKKIYYFLEYIRTNFYLSTTDFDKEFIEKITSRSGIEKVKVSQLFALIQHIQRANSVSQADLLELNRRIEEFRKETRN